MPAESGNQQMIYNDLSQMDLPRDVKSGLADATRKLAYTYMKDNTIRISGKKGLPHWRPGKPRWPGLLPAAVFKV